MAIVENVATHVAESMVDKAIKEVQYLCCYKSYADDFEEEKTSLRSRRDILVKDIKEAEERNETQIEEDVELWLNRANGLIQEDTKGKKKWFGLVLDCFWQYKRGKELEGKTQRIKQLMEQSNFPRVARSTGLPGIEFYSSANFMHFKDRKMQSEKLQVALKDDKKFIIGLYGLGGTGKTRMAIEVGKEVAESKVFDKVIFSVVSKEPNLKKIRDNIAKHLNFSFKEGTDESEQAQQLWKRIAKGEEKVLIILDDLWKEFTLQHVGIPLGHHGKGCCAILLTTRDWGVCRNMGCHETIELEVLNEKDAVDLFLSYAGMSSADGSSNDFKDVALNIVKECGRLPVAIVAVARALKSRPLPEWEQGLERLRNYEAIHDVKEDLKETYNSLRLSYDNLKNEKARQLFLLCSLFPEDFEIHIEILARFAIGLGLCGEANKYSFARSHFTPIKNELIDSCLLSKDGNESLRMHDLVREVALWIGNKQVQMVLNSNTTLMENIQYSFWHIADFPNHFVSNHIDGTKLEALLVWIYNANSSTVEVSDGIFRGMENLKILALGSMSKLKISADSLFQSSLSLINVRTLAISEFELGDISILVNLKSLESLDLNICTIIELPNEIKELEKLRLLEMVDCVIERNNPFEVIGSCLQLEELYYVSNSMVESVAQITTLPKLQRYYISGMPNELDFSVSGYFNSEGLRVNFSNEILKSLAARADVLKLEGGYYYNRGWSNIVPDILSGEDGSMKDHLTRLCLKSMNEIKCLIYTEHLRSGVAIFSKLVKLKLYSMEVRKLCCGPYPTDFLKQLKRLHLSSCGKLENTLFDDKLELCNLEAIYLERCSMACLFHPSAAESLKQLQTLDIEGCAELKYIVAETMDDHQPNQESIESMFPKLKYLELISCPELEFILPICFCEDLPLLESMRIRDCGKLKYIFGQYQKERDLHQMGKEAILPLLKEVEIGEVTNFINIYTECYLASHCSEEAQKSSPITKVEDGSNSLSRGCLSCFCPKLNASTIHHRSASMNIQLNHNHESKVNYVVNRAHGLFTPPLYPYTSLRRMQISGLSGLKSLFTLSIASSLKLLEVLHVRYCDTLEHIVTDKEHDHELMNVNFVFPNLREVLVENCSQLEYIFPAFYSRGLKNLKSVYITKAENLTHVFGKCRADQNHNVEVDLNLPALKTLHLVDLPNMISMCVQSYCMKELYLGNIRLEGCLQLSLETSTDLLGVGHKRQDLSRRKALSLEENGYMTFQNLSFLTIKGCKELKFVFSASTSRRLKKLRKLEVSDCEELVSIIEDEENMKNSMASYQVCLPELRGVTVKHCRSLKCVFPLSCGKFPRLIYVNVEDAPELGQVFGWNQGGGRKLIIMEDVLPKLKAIRLVNLPSLHTIYEGIDFQIVKICHVRECPTISLTSANDSRSELLELLQPFRRYNIDEDDYWIRDISGWWTYENEKASDEDIEEDSPIHKQNHIPTNLSETKEEGSQEDIGNDSTMSQQNNGSPNFENSEEVSREIAKEDFTSLKQSSNLPNLTKSTNASANETVEEKLSTTPSSNSVVMNLKETFREAPSSEKYDKASSSTCSKPKIEEPYTSIPSEELCGNESMGDQQALGESRSSDEAPQTVEDPTNGCSSKETSNEMALTVPLSNTGMTSPLISSISSPEKPQIATSATHLEMESGSSAITDQSSLDKSTNQPETSTEREIELDQGRHQQFEEHDLMRLFQIMKEGVDMPCVSKIVADLQDNEEVSKAVSDLEGSLKMNLNEIACSEESILRLQNSLKILSSHCSEEGAPSHGLQSTIHSLQQEIQTVLSSFNQANATIDSFTKLQQKEKLMIEQRSKREKEAKTLLSDIDNTKNSIAEAKMKEAELKEQISKLQAELSFKEKEIEHCERKLLCLQEQEKKSVSETIGFTMEFLAMEKARSHMLEDQMKAMQQLQNMDAKWSSCLSNLKKATVLLGVHLKQKL